MKSVTSVAAALALPVLTQAAIFESDLVGDEVRDLSSIPKGKNCTKYVSSKKLQKLINIEDLLSGSQKLQDFADANGGNRVFGSGGHNATVDWLVETLEATGYYDVEKQPFTELYAEADGTFSYGGNEIETETFSYTPGGEVKAPIIKVDNLGCEEADYPAELEGNIALISRGECDFGLKAANAKAAGAAGAIIYNNQAGGLSGTLGDPTRDYAPVLGISQEDGEALVAALEEGEVEGDLYVDAIVENRVNYNVIAETKQGDHDNVLVLGGHSDSVAAGPGIKYACSFPQTTQLILLTD